MRALAALLAVLGTLTVAPASAREPAAGLVLVAARSTGSVFRHSIVYLLDHSAEGSLGLIINRPTEAVLKDALPQLGEIDRRGHLLGYGGPVGLDSLKFLLRRDEAPEETVEVEQGVYASGSPQLLERLLRADVARADLRVFIGYAGWAPGQLEAELRRGAWYVRRLPPEAVFDPAPDLWEELIEQLDPPGIRIALPPPAFV